MDFPFHHIKKIHRKMTDVFFGSKQRFISFKNDPKQKWIFDLSPEHIKSILRHDYAYICYGVLIIASFVIILYSDRAKAQAIFYPASCLGGWTNTGKATGPADLPDGSDTTLFNSENSAILKNTNAEIYCGSFTGDIPKDTEPKKFYLSFSWSIDDGSIIHSEPQPFTPINTDNQLPAPTTTNQSTDSSNTTTPSDTKIDSPAPSPSPENPPQSFFWNYFTKTVYAQNPIFPDSDIPKEIEQPAVSTDANEISVLPATAESLAESQPKALPLNQILDDATNLLDKTKTEIIPAENKPQNFLAISYTLDGATWSPLGEVNSSNWKGARFTVPLSGWDDVSKMQVSMKIIQTIDKIPAVYLDAMRVEVEYESIIGTVTPSSYHIASMTSNTSGFSLSLGGHPPEREDILVSSTVNPISGLAVYDTGSGVLRLNTYVNGLSYYLDTEYFGVGDFTAISTKDKNICSDKSLADCLSSPDVESSGTFSVVLKIKPSSLPPVPESIPTLAPEVPTPAPQPEAGQPSAETPTPAPEAPTQTPNVLP